MAAPERVSQPRRWRRYLIDGGLLLTVLFAVHLWQTRHVPDGQAPMLDGLLSSGEAFSLAAFQARHPGQAVALHFWAEWCPICRVEERNISALVGEMPVLTVAMQSGDSTAIERVLVERKLDWPALVDRDGKMSARYGLQGVPAFVVIDAGGKLRFAEVGYVTELGMRWRLWWATQFP